MSLVVCREFSHSANLCKRTSLQTTKDKGQHRTGQDEEQNRLCFPRSGKLSRLGQILTANPASVR